MRRKPKPPTADVCCAVCGEPLTLWDVTTGFEGHTVHAPGRGCLGGELARLEAREAEEPREEACGLWCEDC